MIMEIFCFFDDFIVLLLIAFIVIRVDTQIRSHFDRKCVPVTILIAKRHLFDPQYEALP